MKISIILVKNGCAIALKGRKAKLEAITDVQFAEKDEITQAYIFLNLEDKILSHVKIIDIQLKNFGIV